MPTPVSITNAPAAIGPYSQASAFCSLVFVSGQIPLHPVSLTMPDDIAEQTRQSLENIKVILEASHAGLDTVLKTTIFLTDMQDFAVVNAVYAEFFPAPCPARSCVAVKELPRGARIEIEAIAHKKDAQ